MPNPIKPPLRPMPGSPSGKPPEINRPVIRPVGPPQRVMPTIAPPVSQPKGPMSPPPVAVRAALMGRSLSPQPQPVSAINTFNWGSLSLNTSGAHADISSEVASLGSSLDDLQRRSTFNNVAAEINNLDNTLTNLIAISESARSEGYIYQNDIDNLAYQLKTQWDASRTQLFNNLQQQASMMQNRLPSLSPQIQNLNRVLSNPVDARPLIQSTHTQVNNLLQTVDQIERSLENDYNPIKTQAERLTTRLTNIHWAMDQLTGAVFKLSSEEALVIAVSARWDKEGKEDPEGVLYLTNKSLIFERKEKVATKKVLFITTASQLVQEALINQPLTNIRNIRAENKGLFKNQDYLFVQFSDPKLGEVAFHINGQESKDWASLVERARSGQIETERFSASGISVADLTRTLTPADIVEIQNQVSLIQDELMLKGSHEELAEIENKVTSLGRSLASLRAKGYVVERNLEADIMILGAQWDRTKLAASTVIDYQIRTLSDQSRSLQQTAAQLIGMSDNLNAARPLYMQLKSAIASASAQAEAAQTTVKAQYGAYAQEVEALSAHFEWIDWMLSALSTAGFRLLATECGVAATEAMWGMPGVEPEPGILFLTDQRLLWEDRVGTFELKVNIPLQVIAEVHKEINETTDQGGSGVEFLAFNFNSGAPYSSTRFRLNLPVADEWVKMVGRARGGDYAQDRTVQIDQVEIDRIRNAPQQCSNCGGAFTAPILRGQNQITCQYCNVVVNI